MGTCNIPPRVPTRLPLFLTEFGWHSLYLAYVAYKMLTWAPSVSGLTKAATKSETFLVFLKDKYIYLHFLQLHANLQLT